jgi:hypothetical protein
MALHELDALTNVSGFPVFQSHINYVKGKEDQCLVLSTRKGHTASRGGDNNSNSTDQAIHIQLASPYVRDILQKKVMMVACAIRTLCDGNQEKMFKASEKFAMTGDSLHCLLWN